VAPFLNSSAAVATSTSKGYALSDIDPKMLVTAGDANRNSRIILL
jgi:hypothetical protein